MNEASFSPPAIDPDTPIEILYQDSDLIAANKPGGLLVHRSRESADQVFLLQMLREQLNTYVNPVHRLDRAVSGTILFAYDTDGTRAVQERLVAEDCVKEYLALVRGEPAEKGFCDRPLSDKKGTKKEAYTEYERLLVFPPLDFIRGLTLLKVRIKTGRRHQIRRHLSHIHHHLLGDTSYGKGRINTEFRERYGLPRLFLHSYRLNIRHPASDERMEIRCPLAKDLADFIAQVPGMDLDLLDELSRPNEP